MDLFSKLIRESAGVRAQAAGNLKQIPLSMGPGMGLDLTALRSGPWDHSLSQNQE